MSERSPAPASASPRDVAMLHDASVKVLMQLENVKADITLLQKHLAERSPGKDVGVRILACVLSSVILTQHLVTMQIRAEGK